MEQVLGQSLAIRTLQTALRNGRLHHAYIFHGPVGVGKFTTAYAFAKVLLCHDPQNPRNDAQGDVAACGACESCRLIGDGTPNDTAHPDLRVVAKELARYSDDASVRGRKLTSIPVDVLRQSLIEPVYRAAQIGRRKVLIVDEAELLNDTGQNLLLKTLEEPPLETYLILVTASQEKLLMTIRSRCQRVAFVPLPDELVSQWLEQQSSQLSDEQRSWLIGFAGGSLGRIRLAMDYSLFDWAHTVIPAIDQASQGQYPIDLGQEMKEMIDGFAKRWVDEHTGASKEAANRMAAAVLWSIIGQYARQQIHKLASQCAASDPVANESVLVPWVGVIDALTQAEHKLARNVNLGLVTDHLVSLIYRALTGKKEALV